MGSFFCVNNQNRKGYASVASFDNRISLWYQIDKVTACAVLVYAFRLAGNYFLPHALFGTICKRLFARYVTNRCHVRFGSIV